MCCTNLLVFLLDLLNDSLHLLHCPPLQHQLGLQGVGSVL